mgnify:CR=1 FL=1
MIKHSNKVKKYSISILILFIYLLLLILSFLFILTDKNKELRIVSGDAEIYTDGVWITLNNYMQIPKNSKIRILSEEVEFTKFSLRGKGKSFIVWNDYYLEITSPKIGNLYVEYERGEDLLDLSILSNAKFISIDGKKIYNRGKIRLCLLPKEDIYISAQDEYGNILTEVNISLLPKYWISSSFWSSSSPYAEQITKGKILHVEVEPPTVLKSFWTSSEHLYLLQREISKVDITGSQK